MATSDPYVVPSSVYWVTSLDPDDEGISRRIREDLEPILTERGVRLLLHEPQSAADFLAALSNIEEEARAGDVPFIHLDAHGEVDSGFRIAKTGEAIPWPELSARLRRINIATRNNLIVLSAVCFGMRAARSYNIEEASPFYLLMAPTERVKAGFLADNVVPFYKAIFGGQDLARAFGQYLANKFRVFHCEIVLRELLAAYVRDNAVGGGRWKRREDFFTLAASEGPVADPEERRAVRELAKQFTSPDQQMFERFQRFSKCFMIGRPISFTMQSVVDAARQGTTHALE